ncbi:VUT family protein [Piscirickettsia salmonis]|uniref:VUT family protein n=1 Tax=Piscirickettsia salmonis TaxID=1238 RepID=UPI003A7F8880
MTETTHMRYFHILCAFQVMLFITTNFLNIRLVPINLGNTTFAVGGGVFIFPLSFIIQDICTEVYGYARSRQLLWLSIIGMILSVLYSNFIINQPHFSNKIKNFNNFIFIFSEIPRHTLADITGLIIGSLLNDFLVAKSKIKYKGNLIYFRYISSAFTGEFIYQCISYSMAWVGELGELWQILPFFTFAYIYKITFIISFSPATVLISNKLKSIEELDIYDIATNFNPLKFKVN